MIWLQTGYKIAYWESIWVTQNTSYTQVIPNKVVIYRRATSPYWQMRLKLPYPNKGSVKKSTGAVDKSQAFEVAIKRYSEISYKIDNDITTEKYDFEKLYKAWWKRERQNKSDARISFIEGTIRRYLMPYFMEELQNTDVTTLKDHDFERFWDWRIHYWNSERGKDNLETTQNRRRNKGSWRHSKKGNVSLKRPADKTLQMEGSVIKAIFGWAKRHGIMPHMVYVKPPKDPKNKTFKTSRRPTFEVEEWKQIYLYMRTWVKGAVEGSPNMKNGRYAKSKVPYKRTHALHLYQRKMLQNAVLFMANSGLRPNELRQARWIDLKTDKGGKHYLYVRPSTKTGERDVILREGAERYLLNVKEFSQNTEPTDVIFSSPDGTPHTDFNRTFKKILTELGLLYDSEGRARTIYSLRHFYATQRLIKGEIRIEVLADNLGTSVAHIMNHYRHLSVHNYAESLSKR